MKKCLIVIQNLTKSGSPQTFLHVIDVLRMKGFNVDVFVFSVINETTDLALLEAYKKVCNQIFFDRINMNGLVYKLYPLLLFKRIKKTVSVGEYDLLFTNNIYVSAFFAKKKHKNFKVAYYALGNANLKSHYYLLRKKDKWIKKLACRVDAYIALSSVAIFDEYQIDSAKLHMLMDYPECYFPFLKKKNSPILRLGQIGYFCQNKNQLFSLKLANLLKEDHINVRLSFIGYQSSEEPLYLENLKNQVSELKLDKEVVFLPHDYDKKEFFENIDIFLLPSLHEGLSLALMESQFSNVFSIASDTVPADVDFGLLKRLPLNVNCWKDEIKKQEYLNLKKPKHIYTKDDFNKKLTEIINSLFSF